MVLYQEKGDRQMLDESTLEEKKLKIRWISKDEGARRRATGHLKSKMIQP